MKRIVLVVLACCLMAAVASEKVDALRKFIKEHEKTDLSTAEGDKIRDEIEARKNALSADFSDASLTTCLAWRRRPSCWKIRIPTRGLIIRIASSIQWRTKRSTRS